MKKILILSIAVSFASMIFIHFYAFNKTAIYIDPIYHLYDMKQYYETKTIPVVGNRLMNPEYVTDNTTYARIPGGFYYIVYLIHLSLQKVNPYFLQYSYMMQFLFYQNILFYL